MDYDVSKSGFYGDFGGAFIPEMLYHNIEQLKKNYISIINKSSFKKDLNKLLKDYVGRPTPLTYASNLSEKYSSKIYLKREDLCHTGAHKINNTIGQILLAKELSKKKIIAETGAGQHGVATATVCALMGMECVIYMGEIDIRRQKPNVERMKILGAKVIGIKSGSKTLKDATNEAMRHWINHPDDTHYIIGSVVGPHPYPDIVTRFQSIIGKELKNQLLDAEGRKNPDYIIACVGGGSNAAGIFYNYLYEKKVKLIGVEAGGLGIKTKKSAATTALGKEGILHGSKTLLMQNDDGQIEEPYSISAGLDYPGIGPIHAHLYKTGRELFYNVTDDESMIAGIELSKLEGIIPAIETAHAFAVLKKIKKLRNKLVVFNLSGRGDKDLETYIKWGKY